MSAENKRLKITSGLIGKVRELAELDVEEGCYRPEELTFVVSRADRPKLIKQTKAENPDLSNRQIARKIGVDEKTVRNDLAEKSAKGAEKSASMANGKKLSGDNPDTSAEDMKAKFADLDKSDDDNPIPDIAGDSKKYLSRLLDFKETYLNGVRNWLVKAELDENTKAVLANALHGMANELALLAQEVMDQTTENYNG